MARKNAKDLLDHAPGLDIPLYLTMRFRPTVIPHSSTKPRKSNMTIEPSPAEIAAATAEIRAGWSELTERVRRTGTSEIQCVEVALVRDTESHERRTMDMWAASCDSTGGEDWFAKMRKRK